MNSFDVHRWLDFLKYSNISSQCLGIDWGLMNENFIKLVDVNLVNIYDQRNTLNLSAQFCLDPNVIKFLIVNGVDLQHTSGEGMNSAHYAAAYNPNPKIIDELVQHGLDIKLRTSTNKTALHLAVGNYQYNPEMINTVLAHEIDINAIDDFDNTALHYACARRLSTENLFIKNLLQHHPAINLTNKEGDSAFDLLIKYHHPMNVIRQFLKHPVNITEETLKLCDKYYDRHLKSFLQKHLRQKSQ